MWRGQIVLHNTWTAPKTLMLLKVILRSIKVISTWKNTEPNLKNWTDFKIWMFWEFKILHYLPKGKAKVEIGASVRCSSGRPLFSSGFSPPLFSFFFPPFFPFPPSRPFLIEGVLGSKNLFSESCLGCPKTQGKTPFQTPSALLGPSGGHFGFCRWWRWCPLRR